MSKSLRFAGWIQVCVAGCLLAALTPPVAAQLFDDRLDRLMFQDPELQDNLPRLVFSSDLKDLWLLALQRPESEPRRLAADTLSLARQYGVPKLDDVPQKLAEVLRTEPDERSTRYALAHALVVFDARDSAELLYGLLPQSDLDYAQVVEPALAHWDYLPQRERWLQRLQQPNAEREWLLLAIGGLGAVREPRASADLLRFVQDGDMHVTVRIAAARAASRIEAVDVLPIAQELAAKSQLPERLIAINLIGSRTDDGSIRLLHQLADDESAAIQGIALRALFEFDPKLLYVRAPQDIQHRDVNVRRVAAEALVHQADAQAIDTLGLLLGDANPGLRRYVSDAYLVFAEGDLKEAVIAECMQVLAGDTWRGLEQSLVVLGKLDHEPSAGRMIELLEHPRPEVMVAAAWGLRRLDLPETLPGLLEFCQRRFEATSTGKLDVRYAVAYDEQVGSLFQLFGKQRFASADSFMRKYIPKLTPGIDFAGYARPAAIWALGQIHENQAEPELTQAFSERLKDVTSMFPERDMVRRMAAVSLARMRSKSELETLRRFQMDDGPGRFAGPACRWGIQHLTGEVIKPPQPGVVGMNNWFLVPRD